LRLAETNGWADRTQTPALESVDRKQACNDAAVCTG